MNAAALFNTRERQDPGALAVRWDGGSMTYGELGNQARRAAAALAARGVGVDDRVALLLPTDPRFPVALLGTLWLGATAAVLSPLWRAGDTLQALLDADVQVLVTTQALAAGLGALPCPTLLVDAATGYESFTHALAVARADHGAPPRSRDAHHPATILYSSGTTGDPKGIVLSHGNLAFTAQSKVRYCRILPSDALALVVPISHCFGQNVVLLGAFAAGASVRLYQRFDAHQLCIGIERGEVSHLYGPPPVFRRLLDAAPGSTLRRLRCALSAAAPLPEPLAERWRDVTGRPLRQGYGLTESSPFATFADDGSVDVGRAIDGVQVRIAEVDGAGWLEANALGEIVLRGPNVMLGYWRRPDATARVLRDGWLRTGDLGWLTADGRLCVVDRLDDVINVAGFKVHPSDVERAALAHPAVGDAAAYRLPDGARGWCVALDVVPRDASRATDAGELRAFIDARLARFQRPVRLRLVSGLPRSPSGKVLRRVLTASVGD